MRRDIFREHDRATLKAGRDPSTGRFLTKRERARLLHRKLYRKNPIALYGNPRGRKRNPGFSAGIRPGDRVSYVDRFGTIRTGRAVMRSSHGGWVLNMGGPHGTPAVVDDSNIVKVSPRKNPGAAWHRQQADTAAEKMRTRSPKMSLYYAGEKDAHDFSARMSKAMGENPRRPILLPMKSLEVRYRRAAGAHKGDLFKHRYGKGVRAFGNPDGSVLLKSTNGKKLWGSVE